jgi:hypothetical protein
MLAVTDFVSGALSRQLHWYEHDRHCVVTLVLRRISAGTAPAARRFCWPTKFKPQVERR